MKSERSDATFHETGLSDILPMAPQRTESPCSRLAFPPEQIIEGEGNHLEPIAVIGFALRFPQDASSSAGFWKLMAERRSTRTEVPSERFDINSWHMPEQWGSLPVRSGHYLAQNLGAFDADFFGINPSEAKAMDPSHRILLETTYQAIESAGLRIEDLRGSNTSVHTGCFTSDYLRQLLNDPERAPTYAGISGALSMLANRVSWLYDLRGPSVNLDSACSSSAMAIDQACNVLRNGDSDLGIVAGCNLTIDPEFSNMLAHMSFLSPDGRSYAFDARANGYARGEGIATVLLQPVSKALAQQNTIRAIIRSSAANQDGRTPVITQPNSDAQRQLILKTYQKAGLDIRHTRFFESHGTGTSVGDPKEAGAIVAVFQKYRTPESPVYIGALKSNIGHLEGASGIAALIKTILILEKGVIVPNYNFETLNPNIEAVSCLSFPNQCISWPQSNSIIRRASINCFGYGGSNCHLVVDDAYSYLQLRGLKGRHLTNISTPSAEESSDATYTTILRGSQSDDEQDMTLETPKAFIWSAASKEALETMIRNWQMYCLSKLSAGTLDVDDLAYTLDTRRSLLAWRSYGIVDTMSDLERLTSIATEPVQSNEKVPLPAFVFTGQGAQWFAMGRELIQYETFRRVLDDATSALQSYGCEWNPEEELMRPEAMSQVNKPELAQPLCAIVQIGIVDLLSEANVYPRVVVGHSMGEIAAAYCTGAISRHAAFKLAYYRGFYVAQVPRKSGFNAGMLAVGLGAEAVQPFLQRDPMQPKHMKLAIACYNSPKSVTVGGEALSLDWLETELGRESIFCRRLKVDAAYHSSQLDCIAENCLHKLRHLDPGVPRPGVRMISTVSAEIVTTKQLQTSSYWVRNLLSPVDFEGAMAKICDQKDHDESEYSVNHIIEVGPHATLKLPIRETLDMYMEASDIRYDSILYRRQRADKTLLHALGSLYRLGYPVSFRKINNAESGSGNPPMTIADGPEYPFNHKNSYWYESRMTRNDRFRKHAHTPLLGKPVPDWSRLRPQWRYCIRSSELDWLCDHTLDGRAVYPASALMSMALSAASQMSDPDCSITAYSIQRARFYLPVAPPLDSDHMETRLMLYPLNVQRNARKWSWRFEILVLNENEWSETCSGVVEIVYDQPSGIIPSDFDNAADSASLEAQCSTPLSPEEVYESLNRSGYQYGPSFKGLKNLSSGSGGLVAASLGFDQSHEVVNAYVIHPACLDNVIQLSLVSLLSNAKEDIDLHVPSAIESFWMSTKDIIGTKSSFRGISKIDSKGHRASKFSISLFDEKTQLPRLSMKGLEMSAITEHSSEPERQASALETVFGTHLAIDVDMLDIAEIHRWLEDQCGPDTIGRQSFWKNIRAYVLYTLRELRNQGFCRDDFPDNRAYMKNYLDWMDWQISRYSESDDAMSIECLESMIQCHGSVGRFFIEMRKNVASVLQGKIDILQLLFGNELINDLYKEQSLGSHYYNKLGTYLRELSWKKPRMKILEIGGGTGSFTQHVLAALQGSVNRPNRFHEYTFSDVSPVFLEKAQVQFGAYATQMKFQVLDLSNQQALDDARNQYDLIVASNVLHVAPDISAALSSVRKMLRPDGKLILHETIAPNNPEIGFGFGLIEGWWGAVEDYRSLSPLLDEAHWQKLLLENGLSAPLTIRDFADDESHLMSIMISNATQSSILPGSGAEYVIVVDLRNSVQKALAATLQSHLTSHSISADVGDIGDPHFQHKGKSAIFLIDTTDPFLLNMTECDLNNLRQWLQFSQRALWVTCGASRASHPAFRLVQGFLNAIRIEYSQLAINTLAFEASALASSQHNDWLGHVMKVLDHLPSDSYGQAGEDYICEGNKLFMQRIDYNDKVSQKLSALHSRQEVISCDVEAARPFLLHFDESRQFSIIAASPSAESLATNEVEIEVHAIGLGGDDAQVYLGLMADKTIGSQGVGIVKGTGTAASLEFQPGDRVCFWKPNALRSGIRVPSRFVARVPDSVTISQAAVKPSSFLCASYILNSFLRLRQGDTVLIWSAEASIGRVIIDIAIASKIRIIAAVHSDEARQELQSTMGSHISVYAVHYGTEELCRSVPSGFRNVIDLSPPPLSFDLLNCLSSSGQIVRIEKPTRSIEERMWMPRLPLNVSLRTTTLDSILDEQLLTIDDVSLSAITDLLALSAARDRATSPASYSLSEVPQALSQLANVDNVIIDFADHQQIRLVKDLTLSYEFVADATYVISGGFGALGCAVARWMARRGARHLVLLSRHGPQSQDALDMLAEFQHDGLTIESPLCDISDYESLEAIFQTLKDTNPRIRGCIHTAGALKVCTKDDVLSDANDKQDVQFDQMTIEDWNVAIAPKVQGSWNLHTLLPSGMDFFVLVSSVMGIIGQATQSNYAAANTFLDALAAHRVSLGEKAISLDVGVLMTGGLVSKTPDIFGRLVGSGQHIPMSRSEIEALLEHCCDPRLEFDAQLLPQIISGVRDPISCGKLGVTPLQAMDRPIWSLVRPTKEHEQDQSRKTSIQNLRIALDATLSEAAAAQIAAKALAERLGVMLSLDYDKISLEQSLADNGADSLCAIELRNWTHRTFGIDITIFELLGDATVASLGQKIVKGMRDRN